MQADGSTSDTHAKQPWWSGTRRHLWVLAGIVVLAGALRFWGLGDLPPGLYRDEALNGMDALGVLDGNTPLFFTANNGREPLYIYLSALAIGLLGPTALAVRLMAAVAGTLTTVTTYGLARRWFGVRVGLLTALLWAITVWPIHLSRIGLRIVLLPLLLSLALWVGTVAYRRSADWRWWVAAGIVYGSTFYTYLAARLTPLFLAPFLLWLFFSGRRQRVWPGLAWALLGAGIALLPLAATVAGAPDLVFGRTGQVSVLNPAINGGDLWGTLWQQIGRTAGMFLWRGDAIIRHNPPGRPVFDLFMALPFLVGVVWCVRQWRRPAALLTLGWTGVMLLSTLLAEDAPHFLRASGVLPAVLIFPAVGLAQLLSWSKLAPALRYGLALLLLLGSVTLTLNDYYREYVHQPETGLLFESAARTLAEQANASVADGTVYIDNRLWEGWPSVAYLLDARVDQWRTTEDGITLTPPATVFAWPFEPATQVRDRLQEPATVTVAYGPPARGDLDPEAAPLYARYTITPGVETAPVALFDNKIQLLSAETTRDTDTTVITLTWRTTGPQPDQLSVFVHGIDETGIATQDDAALGQGLWPAPWWTPQVSVRQSHRLTTNPGVNLDRIEIGLYRPNGDRLPITDPDGNAVGDAWQLYPQHR